MPDFSKRFIIQVIFMAVLGLAFPVPAGAISPPTEAEWKALAIETLREEAWERKIFDTMSENFPAEMERILQEYIAEAKADLRSRTLYLPRFPYGQIQRAVASRPEILAAAPDTELATLAKALARYAEGYRSTPKTCASFATGGGIILEPSIHEDVTSRELMINADLLVATIRAARAGMDQPVNRPVNPQIMKSLTRSFRDRFSRTLDLSARDPVSALSEAKRCDFLVGYYAWVAEQPPHQAAYFMTHARKLSAAGDHIEDGSPFKLLPVRVLHAQK